MSDMRWPEISQEKARYFTTKTHCSCLDFWYRGHIRPCKHVRRLQEAEALLEAQARKWAEREATG